MVLDPSLSREEKNVPTGGQNHVRGGGEKEDTAGKQAKKEVESSMIAVILLKIGI